ncbi:hypothetical protein BC834DRAFT_982385, partial [Gloeopeniophorella convolvens]
REPLRRDKNQTPLWPQDGWCSPEQDHRRDLISLRVESNASQLRRAEDPQRRPLDPLRVGIPLPAPALSGEILAHLVVLDVALHASGRVADAQARRDAVAALPPEVHADDSRAVRADDGRRVRVDVGHPACAGEVGAPRGGRAAHGLELRAVVLDRGAERPGHAVLGARGDGVLDGGGDEGLAARDAHDARVDGVVLEGAEVGAFGPFGVVVDPDAVVGLGLGGSGRLDVRRHRDGGCVENAKRSD